MQGSDAVVQIEAAIQRASLLILVLSRSSLGREAIALEHAQAFARQSGLGRDMILPVILDAAWLRSGRVEILRDYSIIDFTRWGDDNLFQQGVAKVFAALKTIAV